MRKWSQEETLKEQTSLFFSEGETFFPTGVCNYCVPLPCCHRPSLFS